ncbi:Bcr/CflA family multidrug efflux MFS transporter [Olivibacter sitiensis]|uniref:Bcr/CflA family multidrug efflux MFS transporter n=1 Tax=Olivibacter sitiensis TaxID=376470 RepID=UPI00042661E1|nr:Bcr/CflA family multidrug efflux MFS transporter [Olivibacter sitiensis]
MHPVKNKTLTIFILGLLSAIGPFSIDMYLPAFKMMAADMQTDVSHIQLSLTSFFFGIGIGQLAYGPLLDRFGRKKPLLAGLLLYLLASLACAWTKSADHLIFFRFVQALGGCSGMVASRAMVRDFFPPADSAKIFSLLMLVIGISPIIAPTVGGYVVNHWNWHVIFVIMVALSILLLLSVILFLPEGRPANRSISLRPLAIANNYRQVFSIRQFATFALSGAFVASGMYAYLSGSPFVMMELYHISEQHYGWIFGLLATALVASSQLNILALRHFSSLQIARTALICQISASTLLVLLHVTGHIGLYGTIGFIFIFMSCQGFVFPNTSAMAINPFARMAGSASALLGCLQMGIGSISSGIVSLLHNSTAIPMTGTMAFCSLISLLFLLAAPKELLKSGSY